MVEVVQVVEMVDTMLEMMVDQVAVEQEVIQLLVIQEEVEILLLLVHHKEIMVVQVGMEFLLTLKVVAEVAQAQ